jgi:hypothetical protein
MGETRRFFLIFPFFYGFFLAVLMIFFFLFLSFLTPERVFPRGYRHSARENSLPPRARPKGRRSADRASKRAPRPQPSRTRFPDSSPLSHKKLQDSTVLENLKANVEECGFDGVLA